MTLYSISNVKKIDYLYTNGLKPKCELYGIAYYENNERLHSLLDKYYIEYALIPNRL